jgi:hypothetical protein
MQSITTPQGDIILIEAIRAIVKHEKNMTAVVWFLNTQTVCEFDNEQHRSSWMAQARAKIKSRPAATINYFFS